MNKPPLSSTEKGQRYTARLDALARLVTRDPEMTWRKLGTLILKGQYQVTKTKQETQPHAPAN